jgi:DNA-binding NarL/FixJ family response regulator
VAILHVAPYKTPGLCLVTASGWQHRKCRLTPNLRRLESLVRSFKILVVEDFDRFRQFIVLSLRQRAEFQLIYEASDGLEAVERAGELKPDLILLDIGLPRVDGIEAGRRIRKVSPNSKILFVSQESSADVVQEALHLGAQGYLLKADAAGELLPAVNAVLQGGQYLSRRLRPHAISKAHDEYPAGSLPSKEHPPLQPQKGNIVRVHKVAFHPDDASLVDDFTRFIEATLRMENPVIVIATESHRINLGQRLQARGWDMPGAIQEGSYISLDADDMLSGVMVNDWPDSTRFFKVASDLIMEASKAAKGKHFRVAACGECAPRLIAQGRPEAAIHMEHLWDKIARSHYIDILCGYLLRDFQTEESSPIFERICVAHSAAYTL